MKDRKRTASAQRRPDQKTPQDMKRKPDIPQAVKSKPDKKDSQHNSDISNKDVFDNPVLCAQFLRDNFNIPLLKNVQPEDIEDISERYHPYLGTEFESDSVKKIRILDIEKGRKSRDKQKKGQKKGPSFLVSLIDHKSLVDYDVAMQLLRYMVCIWTEYRREEEAKQKGSTKRKSFRYPVIIPIVYFEGKESWTAARNFCERIEKGEQFRQWVPNFQYELVSVHEHSDQELLDRGDEMSLIMLINKIQDMSDMENFIRIPADKLNRIIRDSPEHVVDILVSVMESLCFKMDIPAEERTECVRKVRERKMGYLWENMEKFSIQEERRKTEEQRQRAEEQQQRAEEQQQRAEEQQRRAEEQQQRAEEERQRAEEAEEKLRIAEEKLRLVEEQIKNLEKGRLTD